MYPETARQRSRCDTKTHTWNPSYGIFGAVALGIWYLYKIMGVRNCTEKVSFCTKMR